MEFSTEITTLEDKPLLSQLLQIYLRELSQFEHIPSNDSGNYDYPHLDNYWSDNNRYPYLFFAGEEIAGFALVRKEEYFHSMAEFYVLPKFRRQGIGMFGAINLIKQHPGKWHIEYDARNRIGKLFWSKLVKGIVKECYELFSSKDREYLEFSI